MQNRALHKTKKDNEANSVEEAMKRVRAMNTLCRQSRGALKRPVRILLARIFLMFGGALTLGALVTIPFSALAATPTPHPEPRPKGSTKTQGDFNLTSGRTTLPTDPEKAALTLYMKAVQELSTNPTQSKRDCHRAMGYVGKESRAYKKCEKLVTEADKH